MDMNAATTKPLTATQKKILAFLHEERAKVYTIITRGVILCPSREEYGRMTERRAFVPYHAWDRLEITKIAIQVENRGWRWHPNLNDPRVAAFIGTL
jgi:hypothetical protein